ncbi:MAG: beta-propeller domain-containing protein [Acidimicrobiia bacterium]|nr:beta-propeller domain-containing protein [Acidimicrobiia bacterium]MDX2466207.1 beta-propeller domain-containing protein [Acidimicrobiia bacterium]
MKRITIAFAALVVLAAACSSTSESTVTSTSIGTTRPPIQATTVSYGLQPFDACEDFLDYVKGHAVDMVGPWGFDYGNYGPVFRDFALGGEVFATDDAVAAPTETTAAAGNSLQQGVDFSGTNIQELGVDEPDIIKTDGKRIVVTSGNELYIIDVTGDEPRLAGQTTIEAGWASDLFLAGDRVLVMAAGDIYATPMVDVGFAETSEVFYPTPVSTLVELDISDIENPKVKRTLFIDGAKVSARLVGDSVRLVVSSTPTGLQFKYPETNGLKAERDAEAYNKQIILESTIDNWVPYFVLENAAGLVIDEGSLLDCARAHHPEDFSGLQMLSVVTIDIANDLNIDDAVGVLATGDIVYASTDAMYVASSAWRNWSVFEEDDTEDAINEHTTDIHKFDITDPTSTTYVATGRVTGFMLSQWSMSEYEGNLRVATTSSPDWWWGGNEESESFVTVLEEKEGELVELGKVGGLGKGERIYSVRFIDEVGYVVTFRQTDPLYTIDLSEPTDPRVVGELKILGYSAYLHPVGDGMLLGVGQDATDQGRTLGTQISLFDVSDPANPIRVQNYTFDNGYSSVEYDHRAFLHWPTTGLTVVPVSAWSWDEETGEESGFSGAIAIKATADGIEEVGRITHGEDKAAEEYWWAPQIERSLVIGDSLYTYSHQGLLQSDLETIEPGTYVGFWQ